MAFQNTFKNMVEVCENSKRGVKMGFRFPILFEINISDDHDKVL